MSRDMVVLSLSEYSFLGVTKFPDRMPISNRTS